MIPATWRKTIRFCSKLNDFSALANLEPNANGALRACFLLTRLKKIRNPPIIPCITMRMQEEVQMQRETGWVSRKLSPTAFVLWTIVLAFGLFQMEKYERTPGKSASASVRWHTPSRLSLASDRFTLLLFAHPHCPCTRASLIVLADVLRRTPYPVRAFVIFAKPKGTVLHWERTDLYRLACRLSHVTVLTDENAQEAQRFGARTSGQTLLYDSAGRLLFSGGITAGRSRAEENSGQHSLLAAMNGITAEDRPPPVFGCAL
jgi:hypothetical protein